MSPHFRKTVTEIDGDINKLTGDIERLKTTRDTLVDLYGGETEIAPTPPLKKARKKTGAVPDPVKGEAPHGAGADAPGRLSPESYALIGTVRALPEPLTAETIQVAGNLPTRKDGSNRLTVWFKKGWLERAGWGEYNRSKTFGE